MQEIELVTDCRCLLGEGPVWDDKSSSVLWLDIVAGSIHQHNPASNLFTTFSAGEMIGSIAPFKDGLVAAMQHGFAFINRDTGIIKRIGDPEHDIKGNRFNDGKCDPVGRFWAGTMALSEEAGVGSLYVLHQNLSIDKKIEGVSISNGMAWSHDKTTFYYIDSPSLTVAAYDYDNSSGEISGRRVIITMDRNGGFPDGMTIDTEGMLWIAHWGGWKIARWDPATGKKLLEIKLPVSQVTSCTFGGSGFNDLYITSASIGLSEVQQKREPLAGSLFVIKNCGYTGTPAFEFLG